MTAHVYTHTQTNQADFDLTPPLNKT